MRLLMQRKPNGLLGGVATAYGFVIQKGARAAERLQQAHVERVRNQLDRRVQSTAVAPGFRPPVAY